MTLLDSLVGYWKLDEASGNALDSHGGLNLTDTNTVGAATGIVSGCRDFDSASSEYFTIADNGAVSTGDIDFSFCCWVKLTDKSSTRTILSQWASGVSQSYLLRYDATSDRFQFSIGTGTSGAGSVNANNLGSPSTGTWYFIYAYHDSVNNLVGISVNNGTANTSATSNAPSNSTASFSIGARFTTLTSATEFFSGSIDEVGFWKQLLTAGEVTSLYNAGAGLSYPFGYTQEIITTAGSGTWNVPSGVTSAFVECWGGGGTSGDSSANAQDGAGGGAYAASWITVTPSTSESIHVGSGGANGGASGAGGNGEDTYFRDVSTVMAKGGVKGSSATNGTGGDAASSVGAVKFSGGTGGNRSAQLGAGGGGGGSAFPCGNGGAGGNAVSSSSPGVGGLGFGAGGAGGRNSADIALGSGVNGSAPGGGGGANGAGGPNPRGLGAAGQIRLSYLAGASSGISRRKINHSLVGSSGIGGRLM